MSCCSMDRRASCHSEVWSRPGSDTVRSTALARRSRPGSLQASSGSSPVSEWPRTTVSVGALHPGLQCWHAPASAFRQPSPTCRTAFPAQHLRPSGILGCWPDGLELTPGFYPGSNEQHRLFLGVNLKRTTSRVTSASSALGVFSDNALYKSTRSLTTSLGKCVLRVVIAMLHTAACVSRQPAWHCWPLVFIRPSSAPA